MIAAPSVIMRSLRQRSFQSLKASAIRKAVGRNVQNAHDYGTRAEVEGTAVSKFPGCRAHGRFRFSRLRGLVLSFADKINDFPP
jgi:hypothetical protein